MCSTLCLRASTSVLLIEGVSQDSLSGETTWFSVSYLTNDELAQPGACYLKRRSSRGNGEEQADFARS